MLPMKDRTKLMFAEALEELMKTLPLERVRVSHLCERCGATPPTFYYYFHDKYELVAWMFLQDLSEAVGNGLRDYSPEILNDVSSRIEKRRAFYQKAFTDQSQNNIGKYMQAFNTQLAADALQKHTGQELSADQLFAIRYHVYGIMGMFREWLFDEQMTFEYLNQRLFERTPNFLKEAFANYPYSTESFLRQAGKKTRK